MKWEDLAPVEKDQGEEVEIEVEMDLEAQKHRQDFISEPHLPPTNTTFPFPTLS